MELYPASRESNTAQETSRSPLATHLEVCGLRRRVGLRLRRRSVLRLGADLEQPGRVAEGPGGTVGDGKREEVKPPKRR